MTVNNRVTWSDVSSVILWVNSDCAVLDCRAGARPCSAALVSGTWSHCRAAFQLAAELQSCVSCSPQPLDCETRHFQEKQLNDIKHHENKKDIICAKMRHFCLGGHWYTCTSKVWGYDAWVLILQKIIQDFKFSRFFIGWWSHIIPSAFCVFVRSHYFCLLTDV